MSLSITPKKRFEVRRISLMSLENLGFMPRQVFPHVEISPVGCLPPHGNLNSPQYCVSR